MDLGIIRLAGQLPSSLFPSQTTRTVIKEPNIQLTEEEQAVKRIPRYKATGVDELSAEVVQAAAEAGNEWPFRIFRAAWEQEK